MRIQREPDRSTARGDGPKPADSSGVNLRALGRSASLLSIAAALTAVGNLIFHVILARSAGANTYGATVGLLTFGTIAVHMQSGVQYSVARETALGESNDALLRDGAAAMAPWLVVAALLACASPAIASYLHISSVVPVFVALGYAITLIAFGVPAGIMIGRERFGLFAAYSVLFFVLRFALASLLGWHAANGLGALEATFIAMAITVLIAVAVILRGERESPAEARDSERSNRKALTTESSYGALLSAALWTCWSLPVFFARHFLAAKAAGSFGAAQLVIGGLLFLATPFVSALYPVIVQHRRSKDVLIGLLATVGIGLAGTVGAAVLGPTVLRAMYGDRYSVTAGELFWLGLSVTAVGAATYGLWVAQALRRYRRIVGGGVFVALVAEIGLGAFWHGPNSLAAGPLIAIMLGAAVVMPQLAQVSRKSRRNAADRARRAAELKSSPGLLAFTAVGMMVHNEKNTVEECLHAVLNARDGDAIVPSVVVVVSGSTDGSEQICRSIASTEPRVRVIVEAERSGKANAENKFLAATHEPILALVNADTLLAPKALARLVNALADPAVGMTGGRVVPTNPRRGIANRLVHVVWELHHQVALRDPKLGEVIAFRRCFDSVGGPNLGFDEVSIEAEVRAAGYELCYVPDAWIYNHGPRKLSDYVRHRARNIRGHSSIRTDMGYAPSTMHTHNQLRASIELVASRPSQAPIIGLAGFLEAVAKVSARLPGHRRPNPGVWQPISSAKYSIDVIDLTAPEPAVTLTPSEPLPVATTPEGADHA